MYIGAIWCGGGDGGGGGVGGVGIFGGGGAGGGGGGWASGARLLLPKNSVQVLPTLNLLVFAPPHQLLLPEIGCALQLA